MHQGSENYPNDDVGLMYIGIVGEHLKWMFSIIDHRSLANNYFFGVFHFGGSFMFGLIKITFVF